MANQLKYKDQTFAVGDMINVSLKVKEGEKTRLQIFTGLLIATKGRADNKSFIVRKIGSHGIGVERILPVMSPDIDSISLKQAGTAKRSKLFYLRERTGREALRVNAITVQKTVAPAGELAGATKRTKSSKVSSK